MHLFSVPKEVLWNFDEFFYFVGHDSCDGSFVVAGRVHVAPFNLKFKFGLRMSVDRLTVSTLYTLYAVTECNMNR
jgi:hypothetical protein